MPPRDAFHRRRSPERGGIEDDPQTLHYLGRYEVGIPGMDDNPKTGQSRMTGRITSRRDSREEDWTSQVSRYRRIRIPRERSIAETGAMTQVKTVRSVERSKHRARNL